MNAPDKLPGNGKKTSPPSSIDRLIAAQKREARHVVTELLAMRGLMPLLMKPRNGSHWTAEERLELLSQLRRLSRLSPYLLFLLLPGSALLLPIYAWWLDRRRNVRPDARFGTTPPAQVLPEPSSSSD